VKRIVAYLLLFITVQENILAMDFLFAEDIAKAESKLPVRTSQVVINNNSSATNEPVLCNTLADLLPTHTLSDLSWVGKCFACDKNDQLFFLNTIAFIEGLDKTKKIALCDNGIIRVFFYRNALIEQEKQYVLSQKPIEVSQLTLSPDGNNLAVVADGLCWCIDLRNDTIRACDKKLISWALFQDNNVLLCISMNPFLSIVCFVLENNFLRQFGPGNSELSARNLVIKASQLRLEDVLLVKGHTYLLAYVNPRFKNYLGIKQEFFTSDGRDKFIEFPAKIERVCFNKKADHALVLLENNMVYVVSLTYVSSDMPCWPKQLSQIAIDTTVTPIMVSSNNPIITLKTLENGQQLEQLCA